MKQLKMDLKSVSKDLKSLTKKIERIAKKLDKLEKVQTKKKAKTKTTKKRVAKRKVAKKRVAKKKVARKRVVKKATKLSAIDTVMGVIKKSSKNVETATLQKKTGFGERKIKDIVYRLKKQGKIKSAGRGVYVKV